jgi:hypothetical protein
MQPAVGLSDNPPSKRLNGINRTCSVDHTMAIGTQDHKVSQPNRAPVGCCSQGHDVMNFTEVVPENWIHLPKLELACFAGKLPLIAQNLLLLSLHERAVSLSSKMRHESRLALNCFKIGIGAQREFCRDRAVGPRTTDPRAAEPGRIFGSADGDLLAEPSDDI